jgi:hypothetical protein
MTTAQVVVLGWGAGAVGLALALVVWFQWFRRNLNHVAFGDQVARLCHASNADRARKLCSAAPQSPMANAVRKCLEALDLGPADEPAAETTARLREIYTTSMKADLAGGQRSFYLGAVALADVAIGSYFVLARSVSRGPLFLYAFALLVLANAWVMARRIATQSAAQGERLFPIMAASRNR